MRQYSLILLQLVLGHLTFAQSHNEAATTLSFPPTSVASQSSEQTTLPYAWTGPSSALGSYPSATPSPSPPSNASHCIVTPLGWGRDDSSQILAAVEMCGSGGTITLPAPFVYTIARRMHMKLNNARLQVFGTLSFTPDLLYWIENSFRVEFQNQSAAWLVEGENFEIDGGGWNQGGIDGNGQAWMTHAAGHSNLFGRPISLSVYNSTNVVVKDFAFRQPQFWSIWLQDSSNLEFSGIYINGTNTDPYGNSSNYETNIDGLDTFRVNNLTVRDWVFRGGDDCLAAKGNTTNMAIQNVTCTGGGIAFGSLGQYPEYPDYVYNFTASEISVSQDVRARTGGAVVSGGAYFKSWVGVSEGTPPQGGGGGTGRVSNITFDGLTTSNTSQAVYINKCYYKVANQSQYCDTSTFEFENLLFANVSGTVQGKVGAALNCSQAAPCENIAFADVHLVNSATHASVNATCVNAKNVTGLTCNSTLPMQ